MKAIIHIGSGKTGSTSIQNALTKLANSENFYIEYPLIEKSGHQNIDVIFRNDPKTSSRFVKSIINNDGINYELYKKNMKKSLSEKINPNKHLILSSEYFFNFNHEQILQLKNFLKDHGYREIYILMYIRDPEDYYLSFTSQKLKGSYKIPNPTTFTYKMTNAAELWNDLFSNTEVRQFNKNFLIGNNVITDFSYFIKKTLNININLENTYANKAISTEGLIILQKYRKIFYKNNDGILMKDSTRLAKILERLNSQEEKPVLKQDIKNIIIAKHADQIIKLKEKYGIFSNYDMSTINKQTTIDFKEDDVSSILEVKKSIINLNKLYLNVLKKIL